MRICCLLLCVVVFPGFLKAQEKTKNPSYLTAEYQYGYMLQGNDFVKGVNSTGKAVKSFQAFYFDWGVQSTGKELWHKVLNYPSYGIGGWAALYPNEEMGNAFGVFGHFGSAFLRKPKWSLEYKIRFGMAWYFHPYNAEEYPYNVFTSSNLNDLISLGFLFTYELSPRLELLFDLNVLHNSNGMLSVPDYGVNVIGPSLGLKYYVRGEHEHYMRVHADFPVPRRYSELLVKFFGSAVQNEFGDRARQSSGAYYFIGGLTLTWQRWVTHVSAFGGGLDWTYDGLTAAPKHGSPRKQASFGDKNLLGFFGSYEVRAGHFHLSFQLGYYFMKSSLTENQRLYQRVGLNYDISDNLFFGLALRAYDFSVADFIEWGGGVGFRIPIEFGK